MKKFLHHSRCKIEFKNKSPHTAKHECGDFFKIIYPYKEDRMLQKLNRNEIAKKLPHTGFMLLPDTFEVLGDNAVSTMIVRKNTFFKSMVAALLNKPFDNSIFLDHHFGIFPGVMLIELLNQTAALMILSSRNIKGKPIVCRNDPPPDFGRFPVVGGDKLTATITLLKEKRGMFFFKGTIVKADGKIVLECGVVGAAAEEKTIPQTEQGVSS
jgi:3-hydroxymyristoyl/3-hydroxydecanoyl-(acyl carrier protein) dehydratase